MDADAHAPWRNHAKNTPQSVQAFVVHLAAPGLMDERVGGKEEAAARRHPR
jgi:hypothetical protein